MLPSALLALATAHALGPIAILPPEGRHPLKAQTTIECDTIRIFNPEL